MSSHSDLSPSEVSHCKVSAPAPEAEPLVLDNLVTSILPDSQRPDLIPVFSFNMESLWVGTTQNNNVSRLTRWRQLLDKMKAEGFTL